jgi:hypothetical protein
MLLGETEMEMEETNGNRKPSTGTVSTKWGIYHCDREFAREVGDPCLGIVMAPTKSEAEALARWRGLSGPTGIWAHPLPESSNHDD